MKKIISNKVYDTDTATKVYEYESSELPTDLDYISETMYRKRTGEYFLHCFGGANTKYAIDLGGNSFKSGERITPLSYEQAKLWAEHNMSAWEYEAEFGEVEEEGHVIISVRVESAANKAIRRAASQRGVTIGQIINELAATL